MNRKDAEVRAVVRELDQQMDDLRRNVAAISALLTARAEPDRLEPPQEAKPHDCPA